ncbi:MAG: metal ABC transporter permease [Planctomycetaceae bacterium]|nr:metal ABC transporter permease [Planctomycetaceae bacterium]
MFSEFLELAADWNFRDTWMAATAALAAMACAIPGTFLVLRRQSLMGDALSHTSLLGIIGAILFANALRVSGWIDTETYIATRHAVMFVGAMAIGVFSAFMTEWIQKLGRVEASAALGVVFTSLFALGLLLVRSAPSGLHIDPDCVFYGTIETTAISVKGEPPAPAITNGIMLLVNLTLVVLFAKELKISTFDTELSTTMGINARVMHYGLMAVTAATLVAAFESVGNILVIALLIVPAATAHLLTDRYGRLIGIALVVSALSAFLGHLMAITLPAIIFPRLGFETVRDASTAGMMAGTCGMLFLLAVLFSPRHGIFSQFVQRVRLSVKIAGDDLLGLLYRIEEVDMEERQVGAMDLVRKHLGLGWMMSRLAVASLSRNQQIVSDPSGYHLTDIGRESARKLVRSHRLWEAYMAKHFQLPDTHLHETAARVEHYLNPDIRSQLEDELDTPGADPHGRDIPDERHPEGE